MQAHFATAVERFRQDFVERVNTPLAAMALAPPAEPRDDLIVTAARISAWMDTSADRRLVRAIYLARGGTDRVRDLFVFQRADATFEPAAWPAALAGLRGKLRQRPGGGPPLSIQAADPDLPAVAITHVERPSADGTESSPNGGDLRIAGWVIVEYDLDYLKSEVIPALVGQDLGISDDLDCASRIITAGGRRVIYASDDSIARAALTHADATAPLFEVVVPGPPEGRAIEPNAERSGAWTVQVVNRAGSLDEVVEHARRRNVAVSLGALLLMAGAVAAVLFSARRAQRLAQSQMEFVAGVSHELRTPLSVICSAADNLADGVVSEDSRVRRYGSVISGEGRRLTRILEQILRFAGIQSGRARYQFSRVDLPALIRKAVETADSEIQSAGFVVETAVPPLEILGDEVPLAQCFRNLIENALAHARTGGWIGIHAHPDRRQVAIEVEDRGPGIDPAELSHVFDPFYRGRKALHDQVHGFGLGLTLVRRIIEAHGGSVSVSNRPEGGSRFTVRLPLATAPTQGIAEEESIERETNSAD